MLCAHGTQRGGHRHTWPISLGDVTRAFQVCHPAALEAKMILVSRDWTFPRVSPKGSRRGGGPPHLRQVLSRATLLSGRRPRPGCTKL